MAKNTLLALEILQKSGKYDALKDGFFAQAIWTNSGFFFRIDQKYQAQYYALLRKVFEPVDTSLLKSPLLRPEDKWMIKAIIENRGPKALRRAYILGGMRRKVTKS